MEKEKKMVLRGVKKNKDEFMEFLTKYNVIQLAVAVVVGQAAKELVSSIADNLIMPLVGAVTPGGSWRNWVWKVAGVEFGLGRLVSSLLDFMIVALVVFVVLKKVLRFDVKKVKKNK